MEFAEVVRRRRMVRAYDSSRPVPDETVEKLLAAALRAPSAGHTQGVSFVVLRGPEETAGYWSVTAGPGEPDRWLRGVSAAPVLVLVWTSRAAYLDRYAEPDKGWTDRDPERWSAPYWWVDAGMASMAALLAAVDSGLGACFFGVPVQRIAAVREAFGIPPEQESVGVLSLGYPRADATGRRRVRPGRARSSRVHHGRWSAHPDQHIS